MKRKENERQSEGMRERHGIDCQSNHSALIRSPPPLARHSDEESRGNEKNEEEPLFFARDRTDDHRSDLEKERESL